MHKLPAVLAVLALSSLALAGCSASSDPAASCARSTDAGAAVLGQIAVTGSTAALPTAHIHTPLHTSRTVFEDTHRGTGTIPVTDDAQMVVLDIALYSAQTGDLLDATPYDGDESNLMPLSQWSQPFPGLPAALHCATAGTRTVVALAPHGVSSQAAQSLDMTARDSLVAVVDVRQVYRAAADGAAVYNSGWGLPSVVRAPNGRPGIIVPDAAAPTSLRTVVLKRGDGKKVTNAKPVLLHYTVVDWADKKVALTTWDSTPRVVTLSSLPKGMRAAVEGQTVGSQVMAIMPKSDAVPNATGAQVAVIDILGVTPAGAANATSTGQ